MISPGELSLLFSGRMLSCSSSNKRPSNRSHQQDANIENHRNTELHVAVICACMPTMKPFISRLFPCLFRSPGGDNVPENGLTRYSGRIFEITGSGRIRLRKVDLKHGLSSEGVVNGTPNQGQDINKMGSGTDTSEEYVTDHGETHMLTQSHVSVEPAVDGEKSVTEIATPPSISGTKELSQGSMV